MERVGASLVGAGSSGRSGRSLGLPVGIANGDEEGWVVHGDQGRKSSFAND